MSVPSPSLPSASTIPAAGPSIVPSSSKPAATILSSLQNILTTYQSRSLSAPYLHPYAPSTAIQRKGKEREWSVQEQIDGLRGSIASLKAVLDGPSTDAEVGRLVRALKEVNTHQRAFLPTLPSLLPSSNSPAPLFPSSHLLLHPTSLLQTLATSLGLQAFLEDSQFGLLKTSLAIAGTRFVLDVDLEADPTPGEEGEGDEDEAMSTPAPPIVSTSVSASKQGGGEDSERGTVRLSKLTANYVTASGGTGKSEWITRVLREAIEAYLRLWNDHSDENLAVERVYEREKAVRRVEDGFRALREVDEAGEGRFEELESVAREVQSMTEGEKGSTQLYSVDKNTVFPSFRLLPHPTSDQEKGLPNPIFHIRPTRQNERISAIPSPASNGPETMDPDPATVISPWLKGSWVLEYVGEEGVAGNGLVVRRDWLALAQDKHEAAPDGTEDSVGEAINQGGIRVENLLYQPDPTGVSAQTSFAGMSQQPQPQPFPYAATFVQAPSSSPSLSLPSAPASKPDEQEKRALNQHWSMVQPGPTAWIVGRIRLSAKADLATAIHGLRSQLVLNQLFASVFDPRALELATQAQAQSETIDGIDATEQEEEEDWLANESEQTAFPITAVAEESALRITFPRPPIRSRTASMNVEDDMEMEDVDVEVVVSPSRERPYVRVGLNGTLMDMDMGKMGSSGGRDLVGLVQAVLETL